MWGGGGTWRLVSSINPSVLSHSDSFPWNPRRLFPRNASLVVLIGSVHAADAQLNLCMALLWYFMFVRDALSLSLPESTWEVVGFFSAEEEYILNYSRFLNVGSPVCDTRGNELWWWILPDEQNNNTYVVLHWRQTWELWWGLCAM